MTLALTNRCNQYCRHCSFSCTGEGRDIEISLVRKLLADARRGDFSYLRLTGGEPFLHPHLEEILTLATSLGYSIEIETGDRELEPKMPLLRGQNIAYVALSLSGACRETHDFIRGEGSWARTMRNIELCAQNRHNVRIAYVIDGLNVHEFYDAVSLIERLPVAWATINEILPVGRALEHNLSISPELLPLYVPFAVCKLSPEKFKFASNHSDGYCNYIRGGNCFVNWKGEIALCSYAAFERTVADLSVSTFDEALKSLYDTTAAIIEDSLEHGNRVNCTGCARQYYPAPGAVPGAVPAQEAGQVDWAALGHIKIPAAFNVLLTKKCNLSCEFCEFDCQPQGASLKVDILEKLMKEGSRLGVREIIFDGGEPLLYEYFEEALRLASHHEYHVTLLTNGWYFGDYLPLLLKYGVQRVIFGIDGATAMTNDRIKGRKGAFRRVVEAINLSLQNNLFTGLHLVLTARNYHELDDFLTMAERMLVQYVMISKLIPLGHGRGASHLNLTVEQEDRVRDIYEKHQAFLNRIVFAGAYAKGSEERRHALCYYLNMAEHLCVDWNGKIPLCALGAMYDLPFPSLAGHSLMECLILLSEINRVFCSEREGEFLSWKAGEKYLFCEYCLERLDKGALRYFDADSAAGSVFFSCMPCY